MNVAFSSCSLSMRIALLSFVVSALPSCGEGTVTFGGGDDDGNTTVTVKGNIDDVSPVTTRDIVVFVYAVDKSDGEQCPCPSFPSDRSRGKAAVVESGETDFSLSQLRSGAIRVVFLLDNAGNAADGQIDEGDLIAVLDDVDCELEAVKGNLTVTLKDVDIQFAETAAADCGNGTPPAVGRARADQITQARTTGS